MFSDTDTAAGEAAGSGGTVDPNMATWDEVERGVFFEFNCVENRMGQNIDAVNHRPDS